MSVKIHALSTATPPHELPQDLVQQVAQSILGPKYPQFERLLKTFKTSGIEKRYSVAPIEWFEEDHGWSDRNDLYITGAADLFVDAANKALDQAGWLARDVDVVITVSSTGIATPTLEALASKKIGFRNDIKRVPVFGLGCAGGVSGLSIAETHASAHPGDKVLLVVVETCTLLFRSDRAQKADIIATVLFGDGAAAACLCTDEALDGSEITLGRGYQRTWDDTLGIMGWDVDDTGMGVVFDRSIPDFVSEHFAPAAAEALSAAGLDRDALTRFVCHPGGAKVVDAIENCMELPQGSLNAERETLRQFGNMSAPTVLFVLQAVIKAGEKGQMMAAALGPGFTGSFIPLQISDRTMHA